MATAISHKTIGERVWDVTFNVICGSIYIFLIAPVLVIIPLSFNAQPYFSFTEAMLTFQPDGYSLRWYEDFFGSAEWKASIANSFFIAICATIVSTFLGTLAAIGLSRPSTPYRSAIMAIMISPMIVPLIIIGAGMYFFYSSVGLSNSYTGIIMAHAVLGTPFVVITVTATLVGFDHSLTRAAANLGANPTTVFFKIIVPLITPGIVSGALFAFITSFDEVVVVLFLAGIEQQTVPRQMWSGIREQISPTILAVATMMICISILLLGTLEYLRRRNQRLRGIRET